MSLMFLLAAQAMGPEITTYYPLPSKAQQEADLRKAQGLSPLPEQAAAAPNSAKAAKPEAPKEQVEIKVMSATKVSPDANVVFVPPPDQPPH
jgi:hypothetical protein